MPSQREAGTNDNQSQNRVTVAGYTLTAEVVPELVPAVAIEYKAVEEGYVAREKGATDALLMWAFNEYVAWLADYQKRATDVINKLTKRNFSFEELSKQRPICSPQWTIRPCIHGHDKLYHFMSDFGDLHRQFVRDLKYRYEGAIAYAAHKDGFDMRKNRNLNYGIAKHRAERYDLFAADEEKRGSEYFEIANRVERRINAFWNEMFPPLTYEQESRDAEMLEKLQIEDFNERETEGLPILEHDDPTDPLYCRPI